RMLQSIQVLQLGGLELEAFLRDAAESNEALELAEPEREEPLAPLRTRAPRDATERHDEWLQNQPDRARPLAEELASDLALLGLDEGTESWARWLVGQLDERGFLSAPDDELLARAQGDGLAGAGPELGAARAALARLEPRGLGARNAIEALLAQVGPDDPQFALVSRLVHEFLGEIAKNRLPAVARALGLELGELRELLERLGELELAPAAALRDEAAPVVQPDLVVEPTPDGSWDVRVVRSNCPSVGIDESFAALSRDKRQSGEVRDYVREKLERARWIVSAVEQRGRTLLAIAHAVFARQRQFLERGPGHLSPLSMTEVAAALELHVSTVSRAVAGKHVQFPFGIFPLRDFFQAAAGDGEQVRDDVREAVRTVFAEEDPARPLSDDEAVEKLAGKGFTLARRTVAKFRTELAIPSSYLRRRHE
ncbi:MAG: RNA polymerase factor sigma-54, partial [Planctomycetota bacterium]|nr:RNA polymerase factor sigma-54 [Planctomycetota bacterium]